MDRRFYLIPAGAILFILFFTVFGERGLLRIYHLNRELTEVNQKIAGLKEENDKLRREVEALRSDRRYLESLARRDFGLVRKNEIIYQFSPPSPATAQPGSETKPAAPGEGSVPPSKQAPPPAAEQPARKP
jgi:cell division protein FtsB